MTVIEAPLKTASPVKFCRDCGKPLARLNTGDTHLYYCTPVVPETLTAVLKPGSEFPEPLPSHVDLHVDNLSELVLRAVCRHFNAHRCVLYSKSKIRTWLRVRQVAAYLLAQEAKLNTYAIAKKLNMSWNRAYDAQNVVAKNYVQYREHISDIRALVSSRVA